MNRTITSPCTCHHKTQDELHGASIRVKNPKKKKAGQEQEYRCTVCGRVSNK